MAIKIAKGLNIAENSMEYTKNVSGIAGKIDTLNEKADLVSSIVEE